MIKIYEKLHKMPEVLKYFSTKEYDIRHDNVSALHNKLSEDERRIFPFEKHVNMEQYCSDICLGIKLYIYGENLDNAEAEIRNYKR